MTPPQRTPARWKRVAAAIAILVALQAAAIGVFLAVDRGHRKPARPARAATALAARPAPALRIERSSRAVEALADRRGHVVLVHFWATWCPPCRKELPTLLAVAAELKQSGRFELLAVSVDDDWPTLDTYFQGAVPLDVVRAVTKDAHLQYGASTLPDSYLVDGDGNLIARFAGAQDWRARDVRAYLDEVLTPGAIRSTAR